MSSFIVREKANMKKNLWHFFYFFIFILQIFTQSTAMIIFLKLKIVSHYTITKDDKRIDQIILINRWPELIPTLLAHIGTPDVLKMYNALLAMRKLVKRYEYKPK